MTNTEVFLKNAGLREFPHCLFRQNPDVELLDLSCNHLETLPEDLPKLSKLKILFLTQNRFGEIPRILAHCPSLELVSFKSNGLEQIPEDSLPSHIRWLILTDNKLKSLPRSFGKFSGLQKLALSGNQLSELPREIRHCHRLELIRLACNNLQHFPAELLELPRLSWLGFAGNPFSKKHPATLSIPEIPYQEVQLLENIGKGLGGSGLIYRATYKPRHAREACVAVKAFRGDLLADGSPLDELDAWCRVPPHPNVLGLRGRLVGHPEHKHALVFDFLSERFRNVARPPNFTTCTRDVYRPEDAFDLPFVLALLKNVAEATHHLHQHNVLHGDLYAHNILANASGHALLTDFGAASPLPMDAAELKMALAHTDIRAFGCLIEELLGKLTTPPALVTRLQELAVKCLHPTPKEKPSLRNIIEELPSIGP